MSVAAMSAVFTSSKSTLGSRLVMLAIADHADDNFEAWPSIKSLAEKSLLSERMVQYALRGLSKLGELEVVLKKGPRGCNLFRLKLRMVSAIGSGAMDCTGANIAGCNPRHNGVQILDQGGAMDCTRTIREPSENHQEEVLAGSGKELKLPGEVVYWNSKPGIRKVKSWTESRQKTLIARRKDPFWLENFSEGIDRIAASPFCTGQNDRNWRADFDFFMKPNSLAKAMEGKYDSQTSPTADRKPWEPTPVQKRLAAIFNRRPDFHWEPAELAAFSRLVVDEEDLKAVERWHKAVPKDGEQLHRRTDLLAVLSNWTSEVDRARAYKPHREYNL